MRRPRLAIRIVAAGVAVSALTSVARAQFECEFLPGHLQISLEPGFSIGDINLAYGTTTRDSLPPLYLLELPLGGDEQTFLDLFELDLRIADAEPAYLSDTPEGAREMVFGAVGGTIEEFEGQDFADRIHLPEIHAHTTGESTRVAVLDTGVRFDHPALAGVLETGGYDFVGDDADPSEETSGTDDDADGDTDEGAGHGTMVAGIVHLVAPSAEILPLRVLDDEGRGLIFDVAKGIRFAVDEGADVINLSLGLTCTSRIVQHEIQRADSAGVSLAAAAGNDNQEVLAYYPASDSRVLSVTSLDSLDIKADFANYHVTVALSAPGTSILAPYIDGDYAVGSGTSFSTPMVAGQCALIRSLGPSLTKGEVDSLAELGVVDIYQIPENLPYLARLGSGRLDGIATWTHLASAVSVGAAHSQPASQRPSLCILRNPALRADGVAIALAGRAPTGTQLRIYDASGRRVRTLPVVADRVVLWDGRDERGRWVSPGVYYLRAGIADSGQTIGAAARVVLHD